MAELADALDLGSSGLIRAGSSPVTRTIKESVRTIRTLNIKNLRKVLFYVIMYLSRKLAYNIKGILNSHMLSVAIKFYVST